MTEPPNTFSDEFMEFLNPDSSNAGKESNDHPIKWETCVGDDCHEEKFIVGSEGSGSIDRLTYCADCYHNAAISNADEKAPNADENELVDLTGDDEKEKQEANSLLKKDYGCEGDDGLPFRNPKPLFEHLAVVNTLDNYSAEFNIATTSTPSTKTLKFKLLPKNTLMAHTILFVCTCILRPLLYWYKTTFKCVISWVYYSIYVGMIMCTGL